VTGRDAIDPGSDPHNAPEIARADVFADDLVGCPEQAPRGMDSPTPEGESEGDRREAAGKPVHATANHEIGAPPKLFNKVAPLMSAIGAGR
jgi:hypothetical protein